MTKILVVDDSPDMVGLLAKIVEDQQYEVLTATSGKQALRLAASEPVNAILLDVMMPCMNGFEVLCKLKEDQRLRSVPVLLVTARGEDEDVIRGLEAGAHDYVTKPFKSQVLSARLRAAVRGKQDRDRLVQVYEQLKAEIAERKRMEQDLLRRRNWKPSEQLAAGIAHEINTPAQYVGDNTRFLDNAFADIGTLLDVLQRLLAAAKRGPVPERLAAEADAAVCKADLAYLKEGDPRRDPTVAGRDRAGGGHRQGHEGVRPSRQRPQAVPRPEPGHPEHADRLAQRMEVRRQRGHRFCAGPAAGSLPGGRLQPGHSQSGRQRRAGHRRGGRRRRERQRHDHRPHAARRRLGRDPGRGHGERNPRKHPRQSLRSVLHYQGTSAGGPAWDSPSPTPSSCRSTAAASISRRKKAKVPCLRSACRPPSPRQRPSRPGGNHYWRSPYDNPCQT